MQRYFIDSNLKTLSQDQMHHMINVMRFKTKDQVEICEDGICHLVELLIDDKNVTFKNLNKLEDNHSLPVTIIQGLPKGDKIEDVTKYATLFGASKIIFVPMKRSIAKLANIDHKLSRLKKIATEAAELSKRSDVPEILFISSLKDVKLTKDDGLVICDEDEKSYSLKEYIKEVNPKHYVVVIGPEGGIDATERVYFRTLNATTITLGKNIIPTELAHIPFLNAIRYEV